MVHCIKNPSTILRHRSVVTKMGQEFYTGKFDGLAKLIRCLSSLASVSEKEARKRFLCGLD